MKSVFFNVTDLASTERLDVFCSRCMGINRSKFKSGLHLIKVNGLVAKISKKIDNGDVIEVCWENPIPDNIIAEPIKLSVVYEDDSIIVVNKPAGMVTHPGSGNYYHTLVNALEYYRRNVSSYSDELSSMSLKMDDVSIRRGIVHRLDKDTSGLIVTARADKSVDFLKDEFKFHRVSKYYLAVLTGIPKIRSAHVKTSIFRSKSHPSQFRASLDLSKGKFAHSEYKVLKEFKECSLVLFRIYTGRTHQIRVHAKFLGHPIVGDPIYGKGNGYKLLLHAVQIKFRHPKTYEVMKFRTKLPIRFKYFLK